MILDHDGALPNIDPTARIAPNATISGDVTIGANCSIGFGAVLTAASGPISLGNNAIVHLRTQLPPDTTVPLGWIAVGNPACILPPETHDEIWEIQKPLDFPGYVFGVDCPAEGATIMPTVMPRYARALAKRHENDES